MFNSFFSRSARCGPTPFKYSIGLDNMSTVCASFFIFYLKSSSMLILHGFPQ